jgi:hypothetical protein
LSARFVHGAILLCCFQLHKNYSKTSLELKVSLSFVRQWVITWNKFLVVRQNLYSTYIQGELKESEYRKEILSRTPKPNDATQRRSV